MQSIKLLLSIQKCMSLQLLNPFKLLWPLQPMQLLPLLWPLQPMQLFQLLGPLALMVITANVFIAATIDITTNIDVAAITVLVLQSSHFSLSKLNKTKSEVFSLERLYKFCIKKKSQTNFRSEKILCPKKNFKKNLVPKNFGLKKSSVWKNFGLKNFGSKILWNQ